MNVGIYVRVSTEEQRAKLDRIKKSYVNGTFTLEDCNSMSKTIDKNIKELELKLEEIDLCDELRFIPEDILLKRDIDYLNKMKYPEKYKKYTKSWNEFTVDLYEHGAIDRETFVDIKDNYSKDKRKDDFER